MMLIIRILKSMISKRIYINAGLEHTKEEEKMEQNEKPQFILKKTGKRAPKKDKRMKFCTERNPQKRVISDLFQFYKSL